MYNDISHKIKVFAKVIAIVGIVLSVLIGLIMMLLGIADGGLPMFISGIITLILGAIFSWIGSFFIYGFGELIEKVTEIAKNTKKE